MSWCKKSWESAFALGIIFVFCAERQNGFMYWYCVALSTAYIAVGFYRAYHNPKIKVKIFEGGQMPTRAHADDAGIDCYARKACVIEPSEVAIVPLGFGVELPAGVELQVRGRSSMAAKGIWCHFGTIDSGYRGEVSAVLLNTSQKPLNVSVGDRVAQGVFAGYSVPPLVAVSRLGATERGAKGFGSTGV